MKDKVLKTIEQYRMLQPGDRVAVGVSGGADSVALLALLCRLGETLPLRLTVCHINHNLRGEESLRDQRFVEELCRRLGVECRVRSVDAAALAQAQGCSVEEAARQARYAFFAQTAGEGGKIATAHTATDNTETVLLNLARGSGLKGLCGIPPVRGNIVRPLIACTRQQTEAFCRANGLEWVEDSTNAADGYTRNRLRHHAVPVLKEQNPALDRTVAAMTERLRRDAEFLDRLARQEAEALTAGEGQLDRKGLLALAEPLQDRVLLGMIAGHSQTPSQLLEICRRAAREGRGGAQLAAGIRFRANSRWVWVEQTGEVPLDGEAELPRLCPGEETELQLGSRRVRAALRSAGPGCSEKIYKFPINNRMSYDTIQNTLVLRTRRPGDRITLARRGVSKSLKKLFCEEKLLPQDRASRLVLADRLGRVYWVEGFGPSAGAEPTCETVQMLELTILE